MYFREPHPYALRSPSELRPPLQQPLGRTARGPSDQAVPAFVAQRRRAHGQRAARAREVCAHLLLVTFPTHGSARGGSEDSRLRRRNSEQADLLKDTALLLEHFSPVWVHDDLLERTSMRITGGERHGWK